MIKEEENWESPLPHKDAGRLHTLIAHAALLTDHDVAAGLQSKKEVMVVRGNGKIDMKFIAESDYLFEK